MSVEGSKAESFPPEAAEEESAAVETGAEQAPLAVRYYGRTDVGLIREHNEDNFLIADLSTGARGLPNGHAEEVALGAHGLLFAVCDGMGGAAAGEVASQMAVDTLYELLSEAEVPGDRDAFARTLVRAIEEAGSRIFGAAKMDRSRRGMGTTATVAAMIDRVLFIGQVGDSRAYVLRDGRLGLVTKDQSLVNQLIEAGQLSEEEAEAFEHSNIILQALGTTEAVNVDLTFLELREGDRLLLCSDGLSGLVHGEVIRETLATVPDLAECAEKLVTMANAAGGHDNITVVVADFAGGDLATADGVDPLYQQYPLPAAENAPSPPTSDVAWSMKSAGAKPGADVKRRSSATAAEPAVTAPPRRAFRGLGLLLVVGLLASGAAYLFRERSPRPSAPTAAEPPSTIAMDRAPRAAEAPGSVRVRTDIEGELFVDGRSLGALAPDAENRFELPPGAYRFEARREGTVVASTTHTILSGDDAELTLEMPTGRTEAEALPDSRTEDSTVRGRGRDSTLALPNEPPSSTATPPRVEERRPITPTTPTSPPKEPTSSAASEPSRSPSSPSLPPNPF